MIAQIAKKLAGHAWTIGPTLHHRICPRQPPASAPWSIQLDDLVVGRLTIYGRHRRKPASDTLVMLIHGLGGHCDSPYVVGAAAAVERAGYACLRLCLRGAQMSGEDLYHSGLTDDVHAALSHPSLADYNDIIIIGFSLGGHVALSTAVEGADSRVRAVAGICPPLDLSNVQAWLDAPARKVYRTYILRELRAMYAEIARRGRAPTPVERIQTVTSLREWDALTVVPRFGFADTNDYYTQMSVGPKLDRLTIPALLMASHHDPMIPADTIEPFVESPSDNLDVCWVDRGGHVFFPPSVDVGFGPHRGAVAQTLDWATGQLDAL